MCDVCSVVRKHYPRDPQVHRQHCLKCVYCGARLIQKLQRVFVLAPPVRREKSRVALSDWMALGHSEARLRALAKATVWAVAPAAAKE